MNAHGMRGAILQQPGKFVVQEMDRPSIKGDEVLVEVKACGICTSELDMWTGQATGLKFPRFIGHEVSGVVSEVGEVVTGYRPGDSVAVFAEGKGYAEYLAAREDCLCKLQPETPFDLALGEPIACSVNGVMKLDPQLNDSVCLVGCGFMGLIMIQVFNLRGVGTLIAVDLRDRVLELAGELGATHVLNPSRSDVKEEVMQLTGGRGVDIGIEAVGTQVSLDLVTELVRMEGKLEVFGYHQGSPRQVNWGYWNWMAFQIVNGHSRSAQRYLDGMSAGLKLLEAGRLQMDRLVTHRYPLEQINQGFQEACQKEEDFLKGVITFE